MISEWPNDIHVLIPAYNASDLLDSFVPKLLSMVPPEKICVVNDASEDDIHGVCKKWSLTCLDHKKNMGKGAALKTGFEYLVKNGAKWIITMDADGQHAVDDIPEFIETAQKNRSAGIIIGARCMKIGIMPLLRIFSNTTTSFILSVFCHTKIKDSQCGYRIYSADLIKKVSLEYPRFQMESEIILKAVFNHFPVLFIDVQTLYSGGPSHISHLKDTFRWIVAVIKIWFKLTFLSRSHKNRKFSGK